MKRRLVIFVLLMLLVPCFLSAQAANSPPGSPTLLLVYADAPTEMTVTTSDGSASAAFIGMSIDAGASISTARTGAELQMTPNGTAIKIAQNTLMRVESLIGDGSATTNAFMLRLGKLRMVAARLSGTSSEAYTISTPTAVLGVRGTDFARRYDPAAGADWLCVLDGTVDVRSPDGRLSVAVVGGQFVQLSEGFVAQPVPSSWVTNNFRDIQFVKAPLPK